MTDGSYLLNSKEWHIKVVKDKHVVYRGNEEFSLDTYEFAKILQRHCNGIEKTVDYSSLLISGGNSVGIGNISTVRTYFKDRRFNKPIIIFNNDPYNFHLEYINVPALLTVWLSSFTLVKTLMSFGLSKLLKVIWYGENGPKK